MKQITLDYLSYCRELLTQKSIVSSVQTLNSLRAKGFIILIAPTLVWNAWVTSSMSQGEACSCCREQNCWYPVVTKSRVIFSQFCNCLKFLTDNLPFISASCAPWYTNATPWQCLFLSGLLKYKGPAVRPADGSTGSWPVVRAAQHHHHAAISPMCHDPMCLSGRDNKHALKRAGKEEGRPQELSRL